MAEEPQVVMLNGGRDVSVALVSGADAFLLQLLGGAPSKTGAATLKVVKNAAGVPFVAVIIANKHVGFLSHVDAQDLVPILGAFEQQGTVAGAKASLAMSADGMPVVKLSLAAPDQLVDAPAVDLFAPVVQASPVPSAPSFPPTPQAQPVYSGQAPGYGETQQKPRFCANCGANAGLAKFCPECGSPVQPTAAPAPQQPAPAYAPPPPPQPIVAQHTAADEERELWSGRPDTLLAPLASQSTKWRITTSRLIAESGLVGKHNDSLELARVRDIQVNKSLKQRARGAGDIVIFSGDVSTPQLTLESVPGVEQVAELLRKQVQIARKQTGVSYHDRL